MIERPRTLPSSSILVASLISLANPRENHARDFTRSSLVGKASIHVSTQPHAHEGANGPNALTPSVISVTTCAHSVPSLAETQLICTLSGSTPTNSTNLRNMVIRRRA